jgi:hypothetical protein
MKTVAFILLGIICVSCQQRAQKEEQRDISSWKGWDEVRKVKVLKLVPSRFDKELIANGTIRAAKNVELLNHEGGYVEKIFVQNGKWVNRGDTLVKLENMRLELALRKARDDYRLAEIEMHSLLLGVGSDDADSAGIPSSIYENLKVQSGLNRAKIYLDQIFLQKEMLIIKAPFSGIIYELDIIEGVWVDQRHPVCRLISSDDHYVEFRIPETGLHQYKEGLEIICEETWNSREALCRGIIDDINPVICDKGSVIIRARILEGQKRLKEGMKVRVITRISLKNVLSVPKKALVLRSNRAIVFEYIDGRAEWHEVTIGGENRKSYLIEEGLEFVDTIIVEGNFDLLNNTPVVLYGN